MYVCIHQVFTTRDFSFHYVVVRCSTSGQKTLSADPMYTSKKLYVFLLFFSIPYINFALLFSLLVVTQIRGHIAGSSPPLATTVRALHFYHEKISALPSSTRVELCLTTLGALSS